MSKKVSAFFLILSGCLWGVISLFIAKLRSFGFSSCDIGFIRMAICTLFLFFALFFYDKKLLKIRLKDVWVFIGTGIVSVTLFSACYFATIINVEAGVAAALLYTSPVFVMLFSALLFKESITPRKIISIIFTVAGCALVSGVAGSDITLSFSSFATGVGAGLFYALYSIFGTVAAKKNYNTFTITFYTFLFATLGFLFLANTVEVIRITSKNLSALPYEFGIALFCGFLPYFLYTVGLRNTQPSFAGVLVATEPLVACAAGILFLGDSAHYTKLLGVAGVLFSIVLLNIKQK